MARLKLTHLTAAAAAATLLVVIGLALTAIVALRSVASAEKRSHAAAHDVVAIERLRAAFEQSVAAARGFLLAGAPEFLQRASRARGEFLKLLEDLALVEEDPTARRQIAAVQRAEHQHDQALVRAIRQRQAGVALPEIERRFESLIAPSRRHVQRELASLAKTREAAASEEMRRGAEGLLHVSRVTGIVSLLALLATAGLALTQIRMARKEGQFLRRWSEFLSVASHEVKSPLATLQLQLQNLTLLLERGETRGDRVTALLQKMKRQTSSMTTLVANVLDASRMRLAATPLDLQPVDLAELVQDTAERMRPSFAEHSTPLELRMPEQVPGHWDRLQLEQVVTNLLSNALKFGHGKPVEVAVRAHGATAKLSVRDHGVGVAPDEQATIFDCFSRAAGQRQPGHGLGLWISQTIVAAHGGTISLSSNPGEGTTFEVTLPRNTDSIRAVSARGRSAPTSVETTQRSEVDSLS